MMEIWSVEGNGEEAGELQVVDRLFTVQNGLSERPCTSPHISPLIFLGPHLQDNSRPLFALKPQCKTHFVILDSPKRQFKQMVSYKGCLELELSVMLYQAGAIRY